MSWMIYRRDVALKFVLVFFYGIKTIHLLSESSRVMKHGSCMTIVDDLPNGLTKMKLPSSLPNQNGLKGRLW